MIYFQYENWRNRGNPQSTCHKNRAITKTGSILNSQVSELQFIFIFYYTIQ